jgi:hypothetical protein
MGKGSEIARWVTEGVEEGLRARYSGSSPVTRGVVEGVYEGITARKLNMPKRRRPARKTPARAVLAGRSRRARARS